MKKLSKKTIGTALGLLSAALVSPLASAGTSQAVIDGFTCAAGEQKVILTLGVDDGFAGSQEAVSPRNQLQNVPAIVSYQQSHNLTATRTYDQVKSNVYFIDSFRQVPKKVSAAWFVTAMKNIGGNDGIYLGHGKKIWASNVSNQHAYGTRVSTAGSNGWTVNGNLYSVDLSALPLRSGAGTLLDYVQGNVTSGARPMDVLLQDDTTIDFATLVLCRTP